jgi:carbon storage regulator
MLVIGRRPGESFLIGADVEVEILDSSPSHVKLGIRAPRTITVLRKEIHLTQQQNRISARQVSLASLNRLVSTLR